MQPPFSAQFDDIYFSAENGLAESRHVFLQGNGLPDRWRHRGRFTIAETGFGTGLNFLAAWTMFDETAPPDAVLDYAAVELYPLSASDIAAALERWRPDLGYRLDALVRQWPMRVPGFHRLHFGRVRLTLIFDDVGQALPQLTAPRGVDAWFLDGFAPAKNPQMWTDDLYKNMAALSAPDATVATFTAAGAVRRGLVAAGFSVEKMPGYGRKRDMTVARRTGTPAATISRARRVAIIGGGLAGTACAWTLQQRGLYPVLYERTTTLATGASGNALSLCNPRFSAQRTPPSDFYTASYALAYRTLGQFSNIGFNPCGTLHLAHTPEKEKRFAGLLESWGWDPAHMNALDTAEASAVAGIALPGPALYLPQSMQVSPRALCHAYAGNCAIKNVDPVIEPAGDGCMVDGILYDAVILAGGPGLLHHPFTASLPLHTVRGQATTVRATPASRLGANISFGGYISAAYGDGLHMVGSSFQKWLAHTDPLQEDDADNLARLAENVPSLAGAYDIVESRAALRVASRDHVPVVGRLSNFANIYVSAAHGSHGILSTLASAEHLADLLDASPGSLGKATQQALSPERFQNILKKNLNH